MLGHLSVDNLGALLANFETTEGVARVRGPAPGIPSRALHSHTTCVSEPEEGGAVPDDRCRPGGLLGHGSIASGRRRPNVH